MASQNENKVIRFFGVNSDHAINWLANDKCQCSGVDAGMGIHSNMASRLMGLMLQQKNQNINC